MASRRDREYKALQRRYREAGEASEASERGVGHIAEAAITGALALGGAIGEPAQASDTTQQGFIETSQQRRSNDRTQHLDEGTRDAGYRRGGTSGS